MTKMLGKVGVGRKVLGRRHEPLCKFPDPKSLQPCREVDHVSVVQRKRILAHYDDENRFRCLESERLQSLFCLAGIRASGSAVNSAW